MAELKLLGTSSARVSAPASRSPGVAESGFTLLEVMLAATVLVLGITTALLTLQRGIRSLDTARGLTFASQVMETELEQLRLRNWAQLQALQDGTDHLVAVAGAPANSSFQCIRTIRDLKEDMKEITLVSTWKGHDGREQTARYVTRYSKSGLYDYFYTAH